MLPADIVTIIGAVLGAVGVSLFPSPLSLAFLFASLALDAIDGRIARKLGQATEHGAMLDWWFDVLIGQALAVMMLVHGHPLEGTAGIAAMLVCQCATSIWRERGFRSSGRAWVTCIALGVVLYG